MADLHNIADQRPETSRSQDGKVDADGGVEGSQLQIAQRLRPAVVLLGGASEQRVGMRGRCTVQPTPPARQASLRYRFSGCTALLVSPVTPRAARLARLPCPALPYPALPCPVLP